MRLLFLITLLIALAVLPIAVNESVALSARTNICRSTDDPEGNPNYYKQGKTRIYLGKKILEEKEDVCETEKLLIEYFCDSKFRTISRRSFPCRQGCSEGQCITQVQVVEEPPADDSSKQSENVTGSQKDEQQDEVSEEKSSEDTPGILGRSLQWVRSTLRSLFLWLASLF